jgi:AcrR family transcriptional regulator
MPFSRKQAHVGCEPDNVTQPTRSARAADRRELIVHAAWRLVARQGLASLTIRAIATEVGSTTGIVMHYFATREAVVEEMIDRLYRRLRETYLAAAPPSAGQKQLRQLLLAALPVKEPVAFGWTLSVALQGESLRSPRIAQLHQDHYQRFEQDILSALAQLLPATVAPSARLLATQRLMVCLDGIGTQFVLRPKSMTPARQRAILELELDGVLSTLANQLISKTK